MEDKSRFREILDYWLIKNGTSVDELKEREWIVLAFVQHLEYLDSVHHIFNNDNINIRRMHHE